MKSQHGDACLPLQQVYEWDRKFENWASRVSDAYYPSRPHTAYTPERMELVEQVIRENRRVTTDEVAVELGISHGSAHHITHDVLQYHKVCARWVPKQLTPDLKERHKELLGRYQNEGEALFQRTVTEDESWVHYFQS
jgi:hypothetical protein